MEQNKYSFETFDEDEETLPEFLDDIFQILLTKTSEEKAQEFMQFFFD